METNETTNDKDNTQSAEGDSVRRVVMQEKSKAYNQVTKIMELLNEASVNCSELMNEPRAKEMQMRIWLPDELIGSAFILEELRDQFLA